MNFFELLGIPQDFNIDIQVLEAAYFKAQRMYHPDRFAGKPDAEKAQALQRSMDINNAYNTLKSPLNRAIYMLSLQGIFAGGERDNVKPSHALLVEVMTLREAFEDTREPGEIAALEAQVATACGQAVDNLSKAFAEATYPQAAQITLGLLYFSKMLDDITLRKKHMASV